MTSLADKERLPREIVAMRVAKELPDGSYVNLGIGIPTLVSSFVPEGRTVFYHSESGILNCGPVVDPGDEEHEDIGLTYRRPTLKDLLTWRLGLAHQRSYSDEQSIFPMLDKTSTSFL